MSIIGVLNWNNETGLQTYPLTSTLVSDDGRQFPNNFIVDANFIQFDNFIPQLTKLTVTDSSIAITLLTDTGSVTSRYYKASYISGILAVPFYSNSRYLGKLIFDTGILDVFANFIAEQVNTKNAFLATTVRSIPTTAGVFSIDNLCGELEFSSTNSLFFLNTGNNNVNMNAVYIPATTGENYLQSINLVTPRENNLLLLGSSTVNVNPVGVNSLIVNLISSATPNIMPSTQ